MCSLKTMMFLTLASGCVLSGCSDGEKEGDKSKVRPPETVAKQNTTITFKGWPDYEYWVGSRKGMGFGRITICEVFDGENTEGYSLDDIKKDSGITFSTGDNFIVFRHYTSYYDFFDYPVRKGDSVRIGHKGGKIAIRSTGNPGLKEYDYRVEDIIRDKAGSAGTYSPVGRYMDAHVAGAERLFADPDFLKEQRKRTMENKIRFVEANTARVRSELYPEVMAFIRTANRVLDSLLEKGLLSKEIHGFYRRKYEGVQLQADIETGRLDSASAAKALAAFAGKGNGYSDKYIRDCILAFSGTHYDGRADIIAVGQGAGRDPRGIYNAARFSSILPDKARDFLLGHLLANIAQAFPDELETYAKSFRADVKDSLVARNVLAGFHLELNKDKNAKIGNAKENLPLENLKHEKSQLAGVFGKQGKKYFYVDFWASWCGPCRAEMPASAKLREAYAGTEMGFAFLSLDDNFKKWEKACAKENLTGERHNYVVTNTADSPFLVNYKVKSIPRYMIMDADGKVVNADALRPSDPKIRQVFDGLLRKR